MTAYFNDIMTKTNFFAISASLSDYVLASRGIESKCGSILCLDDDDDESDGDRKLTFLILVTHVRQLAN